MERLDEYNMILMLNRDLEASIKSVVLDDIIKQQLAEFEEKLRPIVKEHVEQLTFGTIDKVSASLDNMDAFRNDLRLYIQWSDEEKAKLLYKIRETVKIEDIDI